MRRMLALVTTFTLWLALPASAGAPNHVVKASPSTDGEQIIRSGVKVATTGADSVDSTNLAMANPHDCTGCEGVAVAFQAVIMTGNPSTVKPNNLGVAVNSSCTSCKAFAYAYQYVVSADRGTHLSSAGRKEIKGIRQRVADVVVAGLPYDQLDARLGELAVEFKAAVADDLEQSGQDAEDADDTDDDDTDEERAGA